MVNGSSGRYNRLKSPADITATGFGELSRSRARLPAAVVGGVVVEAREGSPSRPSPAAAGACTRWQGRRVHPVAAERGMRRQPLWWRTLAIGDRSTGHSPEAPRRAPPLGVLLPHGGGNRHCSRLTTPSIGSRCPDPSGELREGANPGPAAPPAGCPAALTFWRREHEPRPATPASVLSNDRRRDRDPTVHAHRRRTGSTRSRRWHARGIPSPHGSDL
jgi:hypothetical protein